MKNREWVVIIAVVLVVAVAVSLITANITGNVVIRQGFGRQVQVANTNDVLNMLNKCVRSPFYGSNSFPDDNDGFNGDEICNSHIDGSRRCLFGLKITTLEDNSKPQHIELVTCDTNVGHKSPNEYEGVEYICCSP